jgi:hypothetical protein
MRDDFVLVIATLPKHRLNSSYLRIRRDGMSHRLLDVYKMDLNAGNVIARPEDAYGPSVRRLLELYPDAYFTLAFRDDNIW